MNKLESLKKLLEDRQHINFTLMIFVYTDTDFIATQYIDRMQEIEGYKFEYTDSLQTNSLFDSDDTIKIFRCDTLDSVPVSDYNKYIIITKQVDSNVRAQLDKDIFDIPRLEEWQIKDYVYSSLPDVKPEKLNELIYSCKNNIYRIDNEIQKLQIFKDFNVSSLYEDFLQDGIFNDISKYSVFDFTNSIIKKDKDKLLAIYKEKESIDIEPMGVVTILLNSFRDIITLQFDPRLTPESCGMARNRFWAIKYNCGIYTNKELIKIFDFLLGIDKRVKMGELPTSILIDLILIKILGGSSNG